MPAIVTKFTATTTIDMKELAGDQNDWDKSLMHPMHHIITVKSADGTERSISASQLEIFLQYAEHHAGMGAALDAVALPVAHKLRVVK